MIATNSFIFLHLHKSGGTFVNHALLKYIPDSKRLGYHLPYDNRPHGYDHLPVVGVIRNPWDYYISFYFFQYNSRRPNYVFQIFSDNGRCDLKSTIMNMLMPKPYHFEKLYSFAPLDFTNKGVNLTKNCVISMEACTGGWYSRLYQRMYNGAEVHFMKMENLRDDLLYVVDLYGEQVGSDFDDYVNNSEKKNTSMHQHYSYYYDQELIEKVELQENEIINKFSYGF